MAEQKAMNLDPLTDAPGAHPLGTGLGAALGGKAVAESVNPTAEEAYWRENYHREPYYEAGRTYDDYAPAYRLGLHGRMGYDGSFDDAQDRLASDWERQRESSTLSWPQARQASRAAWNRVNSPSGSHAAMRGASTSTNTMKEATP